MLGVPWWGRGFHAASAEPRSPVCSAPAFVIVTPSAHGSGCVLSLPVQPVQHDLCAPPSPLPSGAPSVQWACFCPQQPVTHGSQGAGGPCAHGASGCPAPARLCGTSWGRALQPQPDGPRGVCAPGTTLGGWQLGRGFPGSPEAASGRSQRRMGRWRLCSALLSGSHGLTSGAQVPCPLECRAWSEGPADWAISAESCGSSRPWSWASRTRS